MDDRELEKNFKEIKKSLNYITELLTEEIDETEEEENGRIRQRPKEE